MQKTVISIISKRVRLPLLLGVFFALTLLAAFYWLQQSNIIFLRQQIDIFRQQIDTLPATVNPKDKVALKKDQLILEQNRVNAQNAVYGTLVQALGGIFFFVTAYFTYCNLKVAEANLKATEEKQVTERFSKAIELLGNEKIEIRLGGIYALERIAKDSPKDSWTIIEILTSFIQEKSPLPLPTSAQSFSLQKLTIDVQAALTVIRRRDSSREQQWQYIELSNTYITGANLAGVDLSGANLTCTDLSGTNLTGADLSGANLFGADLAGANLTRANCSEAKLHGAINLNKANFSSAIFSKADLLAANFSGATLNEAKFNEAKLTRACLDRATLTGADLSGADLLGADFTEAKLLGANFTGANLRLTILTKANLRAADLTRADLTGANLSEALTDERTKFST